MSTQVLRILEKSRRAGLSQRTRVFAMVCATKSFTKGAEAMHMTQPAVSFHIKKLEEEWDRQLIVRTFDNGFRLTETGKDLYDHILKLAKSCVAFETFIFNKLQTERKEYRFEDLDDIGKANAVDEFRSKMEVQKLAELMDQNATYNFDGSLI